MYAAVITHNPKYTCKITHWSLLQIEEPPVVQFPGIVIYERTTESQTGVAPIIQTFNFEDFTSALILAEVPSGSFILKTVVEIEESFDAGAITIGTQSAQGKLMTADEVDMVEGTYERTNYLQLDAAQSYKAFFSGTPTTGNGRIIIIYI